MMDCDNIWPVLYTGASRRYPGEIVPGALYLGAWQHAEDTERLDELSVKRCNGLQHNLATFHNSHHIHAQVAGHSF